MACQRSRLLSELELCLVRANGIEIRVATVKGKAPADTTSCPFLIVLLHGWPEGWFSWRHQLKALAIAGYAVCAPDLRGFGGTTSPPLTRDYRVDVQCQDILELAEALGFRKIVAFGHDFGSYLAWALAWMHPDRVVAVCGMAVPFLGLSPSKEPLLSRLQSVYGKCLAQTPYCATPNEQRKAKFHYILYHNLPHAAEEYDRHAYEALYRIYFTRRSVPCDPPEVTSKLMFPSSTTDPLDARAAPGVWARFPRAESFPSWCSKEEFEYMVKQYRSSGFQGGLQYYQVMDANWNYLRQFQGRKLSPPALFICGLDDRIVTQLHGGLDNIRKGMHRHCANLTNILALPETGHWMQLERPNEVNQALLEFLDGLHSYSSLSKL